MTIPDVPDWSGQKVDLSVSQEIYIGVATLPTPISSALQDCSAYKSLSLFCELTGTAGATPCIVQVEWYSGGVFVGTDRCGMLDGTESATASGTMYWQLPCRGDGFKIVTYGGPSGDIISVQVVGSTRQISGPAVTSDQGQDIQLGAYAVTTSIAAGSLVKYYMGPFIEGVDVYYFSSAAKVNLSIFGLTYDSAAVVQAQTGVIIGTTSGFVSESFPVRNMPVLATVFNGSGAAANYSLTVIGH